MIYKLVAIRDNKASLFYQPQMQVNFDVAKRDFAMMINSSDVKTITGFAPEDFDLYCVGEFDSESGKLGSDKPPEFIVNGRSVKESNDEE